MRGFATRDGGLYVVTGPTFRDASIQAIGEDGVLVPTSTWKAVHEPRAAGTGVYVCRNTTAPTCGIVAVAALERVVGVDPFPAVPDSLKVVAMRLPVPRGRVSFTADGDAWRAPHPGWFGRLWEMMRRW